MEPGSLHDHHVHVVGVGANGTGAWVNPAMLSWRNPLRRLTTAVYLSGAGIKPGPRFGKILDALLDRVLEDPSLNRRDGLLAMAAELATNAPAGE